MKKNIFSAVLAVIMCVAAALPALASEDSEYVGGSSGMLNAQEITDLDLQADNVYQHTASGVYFAFANDAGDTDLNDYAEQYYKANGFSVSAVLMVVNGDKYGFYAAGDAAGVLDDAAREAMWSAYSSAGGSAAGISAYIAKAGELLSAAVTPFPTAAPEETPDITPTVGNVTPPVSQQAVPAANHSGSAVLVIVLVIAAAACAVYFILKKKKSGGK